MLTKSELIPRQWTLDRLGLLSPAQSTGLGTAHQAPSHTVALRTPNSEAVTPSGEKVKILINLNLREHVNNSHEKDLTARMPRRGFFIISHLATLLVIFQLTGRLVGSLLLIV